MYAVGLIVILCSVLWWWKYRRYPPGPMGLPVLGYLPWLNATTPHKSLAGLAKKYGPIYGLNLGSVYTVVLSDAKLIRTTLAKESTTGRAPLFLTHGFSKGLGIIGAQGELWKDQRKFLASFLKMQKFGTKRDYFQKIITHQVQDCIKYLKENPTPKEESQLIFYHNIGSAINNATFGFSYERGNKTWKWLLGQQEEAVKHLGVSGVLNFLPFLRFLPSSQKILKFMFDGQVDTHKLYTETIEERKKEGYQEPPQNVLDAFLLEKSKRSTADSENFYHHRQLLHLLADVFGAGMDTTVVTLNWFCLYMAANPRCQESIQEELDAVITEKRCITLDDRPALQLLDASIMEVLRIRSVTPLGIPHGALSDTEIGGYHVPKGTMIIPFLWAVHTDEKVWEEPETFKPERFLNEEGKVLVSENLIPFQTGKRMCVGDDVAKMTTFLFTANILQNFKITLEDFTKLDLDGVVGITMEPKPHNLIFTPRIP